jgi:hypothetical protein
MSLKFLVILSGVLEVLVGVLTLLRPDVTIQLLFERGVDPIARVLARLFSAGIFALGLASLRARDDLRGRAGRAMIDGLTCYNVIAAVLLIGAAAELRLGGALLWGAGIGHAVLGMLFGSALLVSNSQSEHSFPRPASPSDHFQGDR